MIPLTEFYTGKGEIPFNLMPDEILTEIRLPLPWAPISWSYQRLAMRSAVDYPIINAACVAIMDKGKVETFPELDYAKGGGTPPTNLASDVDTLRDTVARFVAHAADGKAFVRSPAFGRLSGRAYGRLMYVHTSYHLKQFGA